MWLVAIFWKQDNVKFIGLCIDQALAKPTTPNIHVSYFPEEPYVVTDIILFLQGILSCSLHLPFPLCPQEVEMLWRAEGGAILEKLNQEDHEFHVSMGT